MHNEEIQIKEIFTNTIAALNFAVLMVVLGFIIGIYLIFFKPAQFLLFYFMIGFWGFAIILVFISLGYYLYSGSKSEKYYNFDFILKDYLDILFDEQNQNSTHTGIVWSRGYQSLWIELKKADT